MPLNYANAFEGSPVVPVLLATTGSVRPRAGNTASSREGSFDQIRYGGRADGRMRSPARSVAALCP